MDDLSPSSFKKLSQKLYEDGEMVKTFMDNRGDDPDTDNSGL